MLSSNTTDRDLLEGSEWLIEGSIIYTLMPAGNGNLKNRWWAQFTADRECSPDELRGIITLMAAAQDLLTELEESEWEGRSVMTDSPSCPRCGGLKPTHRDGCPREAVLRKARRKD